MDYSSVIFPAYEFRNLYTPTVDLDTDTCSNHDEEKIILLKTIRLPPYCFYSKKA